MVKLKNICKDDKYISAYYAPEGEEEELGYVKIRISDREVVEKRVTSEDGVLGFYYKHVRKALRDILEEGETPKERTVMWY